MGTQTDQNDDAVPDPVVVRYPTVMDGAVLRWFWDEDDANRGREMCSASRNGVFEREEECPLEWLDAAHEVAELLAREGHDADTSHWETHVTGLFRPVRRKESNDA